MNTDNAVRNRYDSALIGRLRGDFKRIDPLLDEIADFRGLSCCMTIPLSLIQRASQLVQAAANGAIDHQIIGPNKSPPTGRGQFQKSG